MTDEDIVKRVQKGDKEAYSYLIDRYKDKVYGMVYGYTYHSSDTNDLSQEVFIRAFRQIHTFKFQSKVSTWLYRIATNCCIDWDRKRRKEQQLLSWIQESAEEHQDHLPEYQLLANEQREIVREIVNKLPHQYKMLIIMYHFQNLKYKEIGEILDMPVKTVEVGLYRARKMIRKQIEIQSGGEGVLWSVEK
ncbi:MAG: RNA polymerase sigma factor [Bacillota bacterium]